MTPSPKVIKNQKRALFFITALSAIISTFFGSYYILKHQNENKKRFNATMYSSEMEITETATESVTKIRDSTTPDLLPSVTVTTMDSKPPLTKNAFITESTAETISKSRSPNPTTAPLPNQSTLEFTSESKTTALIAIEATKGLDTKTLITPFTSTTELTKATNTTELTTDTSTTELTTDTSTTELTTDTSTTELTTDTSTTELTTDTSTTELTTDTSTTELTTDTSTTELTTDTSTTELTTDTSTTELTTDTSTTELTTDTSTTELTTDTNTTELTTDTSTTELTTDTSTTELTTDTSTTDFTTDTSKTTIITTTQQELNHVSTTVLTTVAPRVYRSYNDCNAWTSSKTVQLGLGAVFPLSNVANLFNCANTPTNIKCTEFGYICSASIGLVCTSMACPPTQVAVFCCSASFESLAIVQILPTHPLSVYGTTASSWSFHKECNTLILYKRANPTSTGDFAVDTYYKATILDMCKNRGLKCITGHGLNMLYSRVPLNKFSPTTAASMVTGATGYQGIFIDCRSNTQTVEDKNGLLYLLGNISKLAPTIPLYVATTPINMSAAPNGDIPSFAAMTMQGVNLKAIIPIIQGYEPRHNTNEYFKAEMQRFTSELGYPPNTIIPFNTMHAFVGSNDPLNRTCINKFVGAGNSSNTFLTSEGVTYQYSNIDTMVNNIETSVQAGYLGFGVAEVNCDYSISSNKCFSCIAKITGLNYTHSVYN
ncbi:hypothetical protein [Bufonid herpesvirus 1]|uniref:hypothetical protein n=1 Tax=Bufonid herpesvirus 1 TaxID=2282206 RepID=UPI000EB76048|nr:hypothetical protein [Bufonid herpesvirus 1]AXF48616.1 hypothetical protein [Bufonid herpesvirus 1]